MAPKLFRKSHEKNGFVYHELKFDFGQGRIATRYVSDDTWRARFSDAQSVWMIWNAVNTESAKKPPLQLPLL